LRRPRDFRNARGAGEVQALVITFHSCGHARASLPEWAQDPIFDGEPIFMIVAEMEADRLYFAQLEADEQREAAEAEFAADIADRIAGPCDVCREWPVGRERHQIDGGLAVCSSCTPYESEVA
jgi:hypothetical protein